MHLSTRTHACLDFATAGFLLAAPRLLGASDRFTRITTALALGKVGYTLLTRHEAGVVRVLPMKSHLALDVAGGAALASLPLLLKKENGTIVACAVGAGLFDMAAAPLTETRSLTPGVRGFTTGTTTKLPGEDAPTGAVPREKSLPQASAVDSLKLTMGVVAPTVAMGPIKRQPRVMAAAESLDFASRAVKQLQAMRRKYGSGPLMVKLPLRHQAVLLDPAHVRRVLEESPEPFATASVAKQAALAHFEPKVALVSHGSERKERRRLNEQVLGHRHTVHPMAEGMLATVDEEAQALLGKVRQAGELRWDDFSHAWFCMVRRVVFGNAARDDDRISELMARLRSNANLVSMKRIETHLRDELLERIRGYLERAEPGSLAACMASGSQSPVAAPEHQIPQWLFAFDPAAMATFRTMALLATHPQQLARARAETTGGVAAAKPQRPFLRAAMLESLRLWPTTPMLLRQTTRATEWENGVMPAHTSILIYAPFFHRDETRLPFAHTFSPDVWLDDDPEATGGVPREWTLVPFSGGPGVCPGRNAVLLLGSGMMAALIGDRGIELKNPARLPPGRLPGALDHFTLRFELHGIRGADRLSSHRPHVASNAT